MSLELIPATEAFALVDGTPSPLDRAIKRASNVVLGRGVLRPFRRDDKRDFANADGPALVRACVGQILGMMGSNERVQGELEWDPERGSLLYLLRHQKNSLVLQELGRVYVISALERFEPRVIVRRVAISREKASTGQETVFLIRLVYDVISTNSPGNVVLFSGIDQSVLLPLAA